MDLCNALDLLKMKDIRITKQRLEMMQSILDHAVPFSVADIYAMNSHIVDQATAYRFIKLLNKCSIIRNVVQCDDTQYFELSCKHNPNHPHFLCKNCHQLICLDTLKTSDVLRLAEYAGSQEVEDISVTYTGICKDCGQKTTQSRRQS